jgi:predicted 3-demethylubiquinone-9 3-methyltransferase (glyoxalase superfamily)
MMTTTIYQKYIARYSEIFTLVDMNDGIDFIHSEILPSYMVAKMTDEEYDELFNELMDDKNKKSSWIEKEVY